MLTRRWWLIVKGLVLGVVIALALFYYDPLLTTLRCGFSRSAYKLGRATCTLAGWAAQYCSSTLVKDRPAIPTPSCVAEAKQQRKTYWYTASLFVDQNIDMATNVIMTTSHQVYILTEVHSFRSGGSLSLCDYSSLTPVVLPGPVTVLNCPVGRWITISPPMLDYVEALVGP
jgi:hypothetical protein